MVRGGGYGKTRFPIFVLEKCLSLPPRKGAGNLCGFLTTQVASSPYTVSSSERMSVGICLMKLRYAGGVWNNYNNLTWKRYLRSCSRVNCPTHWNRNLIELNSFLRGNQSINDKLIRCLTFMDWSENVRLCKGVSDWLRERILFIVWSRNLWHLPQTLLFHVLLLT